MRIAAPAVAAKAHAGQFVIVMADERGERIPLTLADWDAGAGTITLIFQSVGHSTRALAALPQGARLPHLLGPLGRATRLLNGGTVICIGGGVGIAEILPVSRAFVDSGSRVIGIIGARTKAQLILEEEMDRCCAQLFVTTDDGSAGTRGSVLIPLKELFDSIEKSTHTKYPDLVYAIGPVAMMKAVSDYTRGAGVRTVVSLNPIMVDATGMCGACRCSVGGKTVFGCVDGPDFDAHAVDFGELSRRLNQYRAQEEQNP